MKCELCTNWSGPDYATTFLADGRVDYEIERLHLRTPDVRNGKCILSPEPVNVTSVHYCKKFSVREGILKDVLRQLADTNGKLSSCETQALHYKELSETLKIKNRSQREKLKQQALKHQAEKLSLLKEIQ